MLTRMMRFGLMTVVMMLAVAWTPAWGQRPVVAVGGILHESNSFHSVKTRLEDFRRPSAATAAATLDLWADNLDEIAGYVQGGRKAGLELVPAIAARATPSGPVTDAALDALTGELIAKLKAAPKLDGILLALHGAMVTESFPHGDAEIVRRVRAAMGETIPLVVTHDFHANVSPEIVKQTTVLLTYKTCPHIDQKERGLQAAEIMGRIARGEVKPVQALVKPGMLYNIRYQYTSVAPLRPIYDEELRLEKEPGVLAVSVSGGYQYADVPAMGASVIVATDGNKAQAEGIAKKLSDMLWATRDQLKLNVPEPAEAVRKAMASAKSPVVLVEMGDNIGGGSAGDATFLLSELMRQKAKGWSVSVAAAVAVAMAVKAGVGARFDGLVGGKTDKMHGEPVRVRGVVKTIYDGKFRETEIRHGGQRYYDQGLSAVVEVEGSTRDEGSYVLLTTKRMVPFSLHQLISAGILPERQKILVVKAAVAFRAAYEPVAGEIIEVDTPGATAINPQRFVWKRVRADLFGMRP
ncbi:MAG: M81 family metallopeptidase [Acidobacteria bacterium]|nr:M81 family metallopeptidase [Acidobacteriota bacterium]